MVKGIKTPEEDKIIAVNRLMKGAPPEDVARDYNVAVSTVEDWKTLYGKSKRRVKRKVMVQPTENTGVSELETEITKLKREAEFWKNAYIHEFRKNIS